MNTKNYDKQKTGRALSMIHMQLKTLIKFGQMTYNQRKCIYDAYELVSQVDREIFIELKELDSAAGV